jgi:hypothetical protein
MRSRTNNSTLDVKTVDVKEALDQPAGVVVCMLGMNDVLSPSLKDFPADYEKWSANYCALIKALRERVHPRVFALATPTMCTENPDSPQNIVMGKLSEKIAAIAKTENCVILPTYETMREVLDEGRSFQPDFHVTGDFVHPNASGHVAIAAGMLKGLGEPEAASSLRQKLTEEIIKRAGPDALSYRVERLSSDPKIPTESFKINYYTHSSQASNASEPSLSVPQGWRVTSFKSGRQGGEFQVEGNPDRLVNSLTLRVGGEQVEITIPAPWLIGYGNSRIRGWANGQWDPTKLVIPCDETLSSGVGFGRLTEIEEGHPLTWKRHIASVDFGGGNASGAIDMAAITFFQNFDIGYGARWIFSDTERPLTIEVKPLGFAAESYMTLWWNGAKLFADPIKNEKDRHFPVTLHRGWNALVFKSTNSRWQWQFMIALQGEHLEDLRISTTPPETPTISPPPQL